MSLDCQDGVKIGVKSNHNRAANPRPIKNFDIGRRRQSNFTDVDAVRASRPKLFGRRAGESLIQQEVQSTILHYAAGVSAALSSRFAAANASA